MLGLMEMQSSKEKNKKAIQEVLNKPVTCFDFWLSPYNGVKLKIN